MVRIIAKRQPLSAWIEQNVRLPAGVAAAPGPIQLYPYQKGIADAIADPKIERVTVLKSARVGYTAVMTAAIAHFMSREPSPILVLMPTEADCRDYMVSDIEPLFLDSPTLCDHLPMPHPGRSDRNKVGDKRAAKLQREHIVRLMAARADKPESANGLRKVLRAMMQHAVEIGLRADDPTRDVRAIRVKSDGFHSWADAEIAQFEKHYEIGSRPRLALALLLYTGQRRGDVVRMGRQHIRTVTVDGGKHQLLYVKQQKTGVELDIPVLPELQSIMAETPGDHLTFLTTQFGKPFTAAGFGNWFRQQCNAAGLPHCSAHGLRKAAARRFAEWGCTVHEIAAWTGHASLREVQRYTKAADQKRLAIAAMAKVKA